jgi:catechol 2,3-dioxygenase-like lactoylglutathione lyase family enzyme
MASPPTARVHHVGVETFDLANSIAWYQDYLGCRLTWSTARLSALTSSRLPAVVRIAEVVAGDLRFHLLERHNGGEPPTVGSAPAIQHVCVAADSAEELRSWRDRWIELYRSGRYEFSRPDQATDIVVDDEGVRSFYCFDVNGLELEFTHVPGCGR